MDTFLFYPPNEPINKNVPETNRRWWKVFGDEQASAFDAYGWSYYTREWAEYWYPGYSDSWGTYRGAIGILYEQARYFGQAVRRASGEIVTYREAVHHQAVASVANVRSLARHRRDVLADYLAGKRRNVGDEAPDQTFVIELGRHPDREARFVSTLTAQGVEVFRAEAPFSAREVLGSRGTAWDERPFAAGVLLVPMRQPLGSLAKAYLEFDPRYDEAALARERRDLERKYQTRIYDLTGWSLPLAFDLDAYVCRDVDVRRTPVESLPAEPTGVEDLGDEGAVYGWIVDGLDDRAVGFAARAMEAGLAVHFADEPFESAGRSFARGSLLVRRHENGDDPRARVEAAARAAGVRAIATGSGRAPSDGPDLGGGHFHLLARPRIALVGNAPMSPDTYGHTWHALDVDLGVPFTLLDAQAFGGYDLRRYNVLVFPPDWSGLGRLLEDHGSALNTWVRSGGTLVASGSAAAALADAELELSGVRLRRDSLEELESYAYAARLERSAGTAPVDAAQVYAPPTLDEPEDAEGEGDDESDAKSKSTDPDEDRHDRWLRVFSPHGVILRGEVNPDEWITAGCAEELAVNFSGSHVLLAARPVHTPVRLAPAERLRLSGLVWPEARERIADSAFLTVERKGAGQVILFATHPGFRGLFRGTGRLFANAVVYGPGLGARQPRDW